jgi:hypothetical protein
VQALRGQREAARLHRGDEFLYALKALTHWILSGTI